MERMNMTLTSNTVFHFRPHLSMYDVRGTLRLAQVAAESLHGIERVELEARCRVDRIRHHICIDTSTDAGRELALIFLGFVRKEFGPDCVSVTAPREGQLQTVGAA